MKTFSCRLRHLPCLRPGRFRHFHETETQPLYLLLPPNGFFWVARALQFFGAQPPPPDGQARAFSFSQIELAALWRGNPESRGA